MVQEHFLNTVNFEENSRMTQLKLWVPAILDYTKKAKSNIHKLCAHALVRVYPLIVHKLPQIMALIFMTVDISQGISQHAKIYGKLYSLCNVSGLPIFDP